MIRYPLVVFHSVQYESYSTYCLISLFLMLERKEHFQLDYLEWFLYHPTCFVWRHSLLDRGSSQDPWRDDTLSTEDAAESTGMDQVILSGTTMYGRPGRPWKANIEPENHELQKASSLSIESLSFSGFYPGCNWVWLNSAPVCLK